MERAGASTDMSRKIPLITTESFTDTHIIDSQRGISQNVNHSIACTVICNNWLKRWCYRIMKFYNICIQLLHSPWHRPCTNGEITLTKLKHFQHIIYHVAAEWFVTFVIKFTYSKGKGLKKCWKMWLSFSKPQPCEYTIGTPKSAKE